MALAIGAGVAWRVRRLRRQPRVYALRAVAGTRRWQVRLVQGWRSAWLQDTRRGACWLTLSLWVGVDPVTSRSVNVTVWRPALPAMHWRRLCVLVGAAQRLVPVGKAP